MPEASEIGIVSREHIIYFGHTLGHSNLSRRSLAWFPTHLRLNTLPLLQPRLRRHTHLLPNDSAVVAGCGGLRRIPLWLTSL